MNSRCICFQFVLGIGFSCNYIYRYGHCPHQKTKHLYSYFLYMVLEESQAHSSSKEAYFSFSYDILSSTIPYYLYSLLSFNIFFFIDHVHAKGPWLILATITATKQKIFYSLSFLSYFLIFQSLFFSFLLSYLSSCLVFFFVDLFFKKTFGLRKYFCLSLFIFPSLFLTK